MSKRNRPLFGLSLIAALAAAGWAQAASDDTMPRTRAEVRQELRAAQASTPLSRDADAPVIEYENQGAGASRAQVKAELQEYRDAGLFAARNLPDTVPLNQLNEREEAFNDRIEARMVSRWSSSQPQPDAQQVLPADPVAQDMNHPALR